MNRTVKRLLAPAAVTAFTAVSILASSLSANATTVACQNGFGDQCSTFGGQNVQSPTPHDVFWDVRGGGAFANNLVIGFGADSPADKATDIVKVLHIGVVPGLPASTSTTKSYSFVYAPNGWWSNMCVSDPGNHLVVLRTCNGKQWQRFIAEQTQNGQPAKTVGALGFNGDRIRDNGNGPNPFGLRDVATNLYVQDISAASSFGPAATPDTRQLVTAGVSTFNDNQLWSWQS